MASTATTRRSATDTLAGLGEWRLTGIATEAGACQCCSRAIRQRVFSVAHPEHGELTLGRRCAARATGYAANRLEQLERSARRVAEMRRREDIMRGELPEGMALVERLEVAGTERQAAGLDPLGAWLVFTSEEKGRLNGVREALVADHLWTAREGGQPTAELWEYLGQWWR